MGSAAVPTFRQTLPYAAGAFLVIMWMTFTLPAWIIGISDFSIEAWPAYQRLIAGDVGGYLHGTPGYVSFTVLVGTPSALLADLVFGGSQRAVFTTLVVPGAVVLAGVAGWLAASARLSGRRSWWVVLLLCAGVEVGRSALRVGHPEDLLAAGAAVGGVLAAMYGRVNAASVLLVVAVLAKQWAVLAILPAVLAAPSGRTRLLVIVGAATVATLVLQVALHPVARGSLTTTGELFYQRNWWYPLGEIPPPGSLGAKSGMLAPPSWLTPLAHPLIVGLALPLSAGWWLARRRSYRPVEDVLGLLALLFLLRCALDPWNVPYYHLPLVVSLVAWEVRSGRFPWLALLTVVSVKLSFPRGWSADRMGMDDWARYTAWTVLLCLVLLFRIYGPREWRAPAVLERSRRAGPGRLPGLRRRPRPT